MVLTASVGDGIGASKIDILLVQFALSKVKLTNKEQPLWPTRGLDGKHSKALTETIILYQKLNKLPATGIVKKGSATIKKLIKDAKLEEAGRTVVGYTSPINVAKIIANANIEANKVFLRGFMPNNDAEELGEIIRKAAEFGIELFVDLKKEFHVDRSTGKISLFLGQRVKKYIVPPVGKAYDFDIANKVLKDIIGKSNIWGLRQGRVQNLISKKGHSFLKIGNFKASQDGIDFFGVDGPLSRLVRFFTNEKSRYDSDWQVKLVIDAAYKIIRDQGPISGEASDKGTSNRLSPTRKARFLKLAEMMAQLDKQLAKNLLDMVFGGNRSGLKFRQLYLLQAAELDVTIPVSKNTYFRLQAQFIMDPNDRKEYLLLRPAVELGSIPEVFFSAGLIKLDRSIVNFRALDVEFFGEGKGTLKFGPVAIEVIFKAEKLIDGEVTKSLKKTDDKTTLSASSKKRKKNKKQNKDEDNDVETKVEKELWAISFGALEIKVLASSEIENDQPIDRNLAFKVGVAFPIFFEVDTDIFDTVYYINSAPLETDLLRF